MRVQPKWAGIKSFLAAEATVEVVAATADDLAGRAAAMVGEIDGYPTPQVARPGTYVQGGAPAMRREDDPSSQRARSAVIAQHPSAAGREAGRQALEAALGGSG